MEMKLQLVPVPVADVDRAKAFYVEQAGFNADIDHQLNEEVRFVQLTPPGSDCSIMLGTGAPMAEPGALRGLMLVVDDIDAVRAGLVARGVEVSEVEAMEWGARHAYFEDPDGNTWQLQEQTGGGD